MSEKSSNTFVSAHEIWVLNQVLPSFDKIEFLWKIDLVLANSVDTREMPHFIRVFTVCQITLLGVSRIQMVNAYTQGRILHICAARGTIMVLIHASFVHASSGSGETGPTAHARLIRRYSHAMYTSSCVLLSLRFVPHEPLSAR